MLEGWDETRAAVVMHLAPTTSERVFVQRLGRVMRPAPEKEAVSVEFLPAGDPMGVQTSHEVFGLGWYKPLGRVAGPPEGGERGKLAKAAALLATREGDSAKLVNPAAAPGLIAAGLADGGWRAADPALLPVTLMEEWVQAAGADVTVDELIDIVAAGVDPLAAVPWWALSGLVARRLHDGLDQPLWRAWATALLVQPDLRRALPDDVPRRVLDRLRMTSRERLRALWWHADQSDRWERLATLEQLGRSSDRRRRWSALDEASVWAPSWAWDVSRILADSTRPGRNQEAARIAAWEAHHLISNGGDLALIGLWLRAAGEPPPDPAPPPEPSPLRLGQAARLLVILGPGDVPARSEHLRLAGRAAGALGGLGRAARLPRRPRPDHPGRAPGRARRRRGHAAEGAPVAPGLERVALAPAAPARGRGRRRRGAPPPRRGRGGRGRATTARPRRRRRRRLRTTPEGGGEGAATATGDAQPQRRDPAHLRHVRGDPGGGRARGAPPSPSPPPPARGAASGGEAPASGPSNGAAES